MCPLIPALLRPETTFTGNYLDEPEAHVKQTLRSLILRPNLAIYPGRNGIAGADFPTQTIGPSKFVLTTGCSRRTPTFVIKRKIGSTGTLLRLRNVGFRSVTSSSVISGVNQSRIADHSELHLWTQTML